jgi:hypothetical protein
MSRMCSRCLGTGHNKLRCPWLQRQAPTAERARRFAPAAPMVFEDHLEVVRIRLPLLRPEELLKVRQLVEAALSVKVTEVLE